MKQRKQRKIEESPELIVKVDHKEKRDSEMIRISIYVKAKSQERVQECRVQNNATISLIDEDNQKKKEKSKLLYLEESPKP